MPTLKYVPQADFGNGVVNASQGAWGVLGAAAGATKKVYDDSISGGPRGLDRGWKDYVSAGWNAGYHNADRMAADAIEEAATLLSPFGIPMEWASLAADYAHQNDGGGNPYRDLDDDQAWGMRTGANYAGFLAPVGIAAKPFGWAMDGVGGATRMLLPYARNTIGKMMVTVPASATYTKMLGLDELPEMYEAVKDAKRGFDDWSKYVLNSEDEDENHHEEGYYEE